MTSTITLQLRKKKKKLDLTHCNKYFRLKEINIDYTHIFITYFSRRTFFTSKLDYTKIVKIEICIKNETYKYKKLYTRILLN